MKIQSITDILNKANVPVFDYETFQCFVDQATYYANKASEHYYDGRDTECDLASRQSIACMEAAKEFNKHVGL